MWKLCGSKTTESQKLAVLITCTSWECFTCRQTALKILKTCQPWQIFASWTFLQTRSKWLKVWKLWWIWNRLICQITRSNLLKTANSYTFYPNCPRLTSRIIRLRVRKVLQNFGLKLKIYSVCMCGETELREWLTNSGAPFWVLVPSLPI